MNRIGGGGGLGGREKREREREREREIFRTVYFVGCLEFTIRENGRQGMLAIRSSRDVKLDNTNKATNKPHLHGWRVQLPSISVYSTTSNFETKLDI